MSTTVDPQPRPSSSRASSGTCSSAPRNGAPCASARRRRRSRRRSFAATPISSAASSSTRSAKPRRARRATSASCSTGCARRASPGSSPPQLAEREDELENRLLAARVTFKRRGDAAPERAGAARGAPGVRRPRGARRDPGRGERRRSTPTGSSCCAPAEELAAEFSGIADRGRAQRGGEGHLAARALDGARSRASDCRTRASARCARSGSRACSATTAPRFRRATTPPTCAGSRRSSRPTRRTARPRSASRRSTALGFDLTAQPNIKLDLDDRPQKSPRACVIASDPPKVVHLITRAQGGLHDYQAFLHEAGHALHYAGCDPELPYTFRRIARDHALTEIYSYIVEAISREPEWHELYFGLVARAGARERRGDDRSSRRCSSAATRRSCASSSTSGRGSRATAAIADVYEQLLTEATGIRYRTDGYLSDMDAGLLLGRLPAGLDPLGAAARAPESTRWARTGGATRAPASCCATSSAKARSRRARRSPCVSASTRSTRRRCCTKSRR